MGMGSGRCSSTPVGMVCIFRFRRTGCGLLCTIRRRIYTARLWTLLVRVFGIPLGTCGGFRCGRRMVLGMAGMVLLRTGGILRLGTRSLRW